MSQSLFNTIGAYTIVEDLGRGGMAQVFLAKDGAGRTVALRRVAPSSGADAIEAERRGAELQRLFRRQCTMVPDVFDTFEADGAFHVAVEFIPGQDLSDLVASGPVAPRRAADIARHLALFLEQATTFEATVNGKKMRHLVHGDLTPRNVRVTANGLIVLDFGISKALSETRRATESKFENTPYVSPERLDTSRMDPADDRWSVGVMLYEMLAGRRPFAGATTRDVERSIRSRRPPLPLAASCPVGLRAVAAKLLAAEGTSRYGDARLLRDDLERFLADQPTEAEQEGWPDMADPDATRPTRAPRDEPTTRASTPAVPAIAAAPPSPSPPPRKSAPARSSLLSALTTPVAAVALAAVVAVAGYGLVSVGLNDARAFRAGERLASTVAAIDDLPALTRAWQQHDGLASRSYTPFVLRGLEEVLVNRTVVLVDRRIKSFGTGVSGIREAQWEEAKAPLVRAMHVRPTDDMRASLRFIEGHLHRIQGDANAGRARALSRQKKAADARNQQLAAQQEWAEALTAFREAAQLRPQWPDPLLGLARTFIYSRDQLETGEDAIRRAQQLGAVDTWPEIQMLADGFARRGATLLASAGSFEGTPQAEQSLRRARDAYARSLQLYDTLPGGLPVDSVRVAQRGLTRVDERLNQLLASGGSAVAPVEAVASQSSPEGVTPPSTVGSGLP